MQPPPDDISICSICHENLHSGIVQIEPCNHQYHQICIERWATQQNKCPLCSQIFTHIQIVPLHNGDCGERIPVETPQKSPEEFQIDGLDHEYFMNEIENLLAESSEIMRQGEVTRRAQHSRVVVAATGERGFAVMQQCCERLASLKAELRRIERFDPVLMLNELYMIQDTMRAVRSGHIPPSTLSSAQPERRRYGADDVDAAQLDELHCGDFETPPALSVQHLYSQVTQSQSHRADASESGILANSRPDSWLVNDSGDGSAGGETGPTLGDFIVQAKPARKGKRGRRKN